VEHGELNQQWAEEKGRRAVRKLEGDEREEMLRRLEEGIEEEYGGVLGSGKIFWLSGVKRTVTNKKRECSSTEGSDYGSVLPDEAEFQETKTTTT